MCECVKWNEVIPNFQAGDIITPFESTFQDQRHADFILDGGVDHRDPLEHCAVIRRASTQKEGVYSSEGKQILPEQFDECQPVIYNSADFYVSAIRVKKDGLYGLYSKNGDLIVPTKFTYVCVQDYLVVVRTPSRFYGAYSLHGEEIIPCEYDSIEFTGSLDDGDGFAIVRKNKLYGVLSEDGTVLVPVQYDYVRENILKGRGFIVTYNQTLQLHGWYSKDGNQMIPCNFKELKFGDYAIVETPKGLLGVYSYEGKEIMPPKFDFITKVGVYLVGLIKQEDISVYNQDGNCLFHTKK